jgi:plasmid stabilization system protein ParE
MRVNRRPQFLLDLAEELTWLRDHAGAGVAEAWHQALKETVRLLRQHPMIGRGRADLSPPGIRSWRVSGHPRWLIFYGIDRDKSLVLYRIRQGTMNLVVLRMKS